MHKETKKRINYNANILDVLARRYGFSVDYIRKALRGDRQGDMPDTLKKEYKALDAESKKAIEAKVQSLKP